MKSKKQRLKDKAWKLFSEYIRRRDANPLTGQTSCVTCGKRAHWKELQAGHFIAGRRLSILFDFRNCHAQCYGCNVGQCGQYVDYFIYMEDRYGRKIINELRRLKHESRKYSIGDYEELIQELQEKLDSLDNMSA